MAGISDLWVGYLRRQEKPTVTCPLCNHEVNNKTLETWQAHVEENPDPHKQLDSEQAIREYFHKFVSSSKQSRTEAHTSARTTRKRSEPAPGDDTGDGDGPPKKRASPPPSNNQQPGDSPDRSRSRPSNPTNDFGGRPVQNHSAKLWMPDDGVRTRTPQGQGRALAAPTSSPRQQAPSNKTSRPSQNAPQPTPANTNPGTSSNIEGETSTMMRQPETRPISQDQLVAEVKGIYAGLVMVETKCIEVDNAQSSNTDANSKLNNEQWQALIALHRTLLHEHHDFFLASQHPSASPALRRLASKYAMPARMWRHGIHSFLELLRHRLPASLEHMLTFLYLAYSMMALLYETVPAFEDTWIECLGDLSRYRMAIEDDDIKDREIWTGVSRHWYSKASDKSPTTGRLYHHLAILARPNALQQLFFYTKSLCVPIPFSSARESIMTLFDPVLSNSPTRLAPIDAAFVRVHAILFSLKSREKLPESMDEFIELLDSYISRSTKRWLEPGYYIGIVLACSLLGYGAEGNILMKAMSRKADETDVPMDGSSIPEAYPDETFALCLSFAVRTIETVIRRWGDTNTLPFLHTTLVFMSHMSQFPAAMAHLEGAYPWKLTSLMLNSLLVSCGPDYEVHSDFRLPEKDQLPRPLPEDFAMRGLLYTEDYHPNVWFKNGKIDEDEKYFELASMVEERKDRILSLGCKLAAPGTWLIWDETSRQFSVPEKYDVELEDVPM